MTSLLLGETHHYHVHQSPFLFLIFFLVILLPTVFGTVMGLLFVVWAAKNKPEWYVALQKKLRPEQKDKSDE
jgi:hypothetical protein